MASSPFPSATPSGIRARRPAVAQGAELARPLVGLAEGLAYSSGLAALVGGAMTGAVGRAFASPSAPRDAALVACGAFVVYGVDRLRDLARDGSSSPRRSAFVARHRPGLLAATGLAGLALAALLAAAPAASVALCLAIGSVGLLHRRLKRDARFKVAYVAAAWTAACVGLPWLGLVEGRLSDGLDLALGGGLAGGGSAGAAGTAFAWALVFVGTAVTANLIASNLREGKRGATGWAPTPALRTASVIAGAGALMVAWAPSACAPLALIPALEWAALQRFRGSERFAHLAVDGALLLGALLAVALSVR